MDETSLSFDMPYPVTLEKCGAKTVSIRTTSREKTSFTIILGCLADGRKLPAVCIFKLKNIPCETFPEDIIIRVNEKDGAMKTRCTIELIMCGLSVVN